MDVRKKRADNTDLWAAKVPANSALVGILWRDIQYVDNWNEDHEVCPARNLVTIGYLLYEGPDPKDASAHMTVVASTYDFDENKWCDYVIFPTEVIKTVKVLKKPTKKKVSVV